MLCMNYQNYNKTVITNSVGGKFRSFLLKYKLAFCAFVSFVLPFSIYVATLEQKLIGGDTSWFAINVPQMTVLVPTGYPSFSIAGKLITFLPVKDIAYRLNLLSAVFGALTILFMFLAINLLLKNEIISLSASLTLAFVFSFWSVANRFEMDTINTFFLSLILYAAFLYKERLERRHLYFAMASLGLFLTDHPIAMFVMPSLLLYIIIINPAIFKKIKAVFLSILFFVLPLGLYLWLPLRSFQGYGPIKTARDFLLYITGRYTTGEIHGGNFGDKDIAGMLEVTKEFFLIIFNNFGPILIAIAFAGLIYIFIRNLKFALCSVLLIVSNFIIIGLYIGWAPENHVLDSILIVSVYLGYGLMLIYDLIKRIFDRVLARAGSGSKTSGPAADKYAAPEPYRSNFIKRTHALKTAVIIIVLAAFILCPTLMAFSNYNKVDASEIDDIYLFWNKIYSIVETNSSIYVASISANIGSYINIYEQADKKIEYHFNGSPTYSTENIKNDLKEGRNIYLVGMEDFINQNFNYTPSINYHWPRFGENIILYKLTGEKMQLVIESPVEQLEIDFGKVITLQYNILNKNNTDIDITSIELEIPGNLSYEGIAENSGINIEPGFSQGKYMWVKNFTINSNGSLKISIIVRAIKPGDAEIGFSVTSQNIYFDAKNIKVKVSQ